MTRFTPTLTALVLALSLVHGEHLIELPIGYRPGFLVQVLYTPPDCTYRAQTGDYMHQHYNGTLTDGTIFDTR